MKNTVPFEILDKVVNIPSIAFSLLYLKITSGQIFY